MAWQEQGSQQSLDPWQSPSNKTKYWERAFFLREVKWIKQTLVGHSGWVQSVAFSPNGQLIASGSYDNTIRLWNPATGFLYRLLEGHLGLVSSITFSLDGQLLASGSYDTTVRVWDPKTGALKYTLEGHSGWVQSVAFSPDGQLIASGSYDNTIRLWNPATGFLYRLLEGHLGLVSSITFSLDSQLLASGSYDMTVRVWNLKTGAVQQILIAKGAVNELRFSQDASYVTTDFGALTIQSKCGSHASSSPCTKVDISILERRWIILNGNKVLWLPPEFRPTCSAVKDSTLALGHTSGKISFMEFRAE
jgi:WD40 repeat protein